MLIFLLLVIILLLILLRLHFDSNKRNENRVGSTRMEKFHGETKMNGVSNLSSMNDYDTTNRHQAVEPLAPEYNITDQTINKKPRAKILTHAVGTKYHKENIRKIIDDAIDYEQVYPFDGMSSSEIKELSDYDSKIYEVNMFDDIGEFIILHEYDNSVSDDALIVEVLTWSGGKYSIGYIPHDDNPRVTTLIDDPDFTDKFYLEVTHGGGKWKMLDMNDSGTDIIRRGTDSYWFDIRIFKKQKSDTVQH